MVERYKFVGSGVTNSQGVAQLTHDANGNPLATPGYVGSGKGLTQMCASLDSPTVMSSGSDQSEIYAVTDGTFKDIATNGKKNNNWTNLNNSIQETVGDDYTVLKSTVASSQNRYSVPTSVIPSAPFVVEFKKYNVVEDNVYIIIGSKAIQLSSVFGGKLKNATHIKFTIDDGNISVEHDGVSETTTYTYTSLNQILFQFNSSDLELWYNDFIIYPI